MTPDNEGGSVPPTSQELKGSWAHSDAVHGFCSTAELSSANTQPGKKFVKDWRYPRVTEWGKNPADTTRSSLPTNSSMTVKKTTTDKKSKLQEANVCQAKWLLVRQGQGTDCRTGHTAYQRAAQHWPGTELPRMLLAAAEPEKPTGTLSEAPALAEGWQPSQ